MNENSINNFNIKIKLLFVITQSWYILMKKYYEENSS